MIANTHIESWFRVLIAIDTNAWSVNSLCLVASFQRKYPPIGEDVTHLCDYLSGCLRRSHEDLSLVSMIALLPSVYMVIDRSLIIWILRLHLLNIVADSHAPMAGAAGRMGFKKTFDLFGVTFQFAQGSLDAEDEMDWLIIDFLLWALTGALVRLDLFVPIRCLSCVYLMLGVGHAESVY